MRPSIGLLTAPMGIVGPNFNCNLPGGHSSNTESCEGFAMQEGSAQYFGSASAPADNKTGAPTATDWRGADGTGSDNSGEIVEGALELTWRLINDIPGILQVLLTDAPDSMKEFKDGYSADKGATSAAMITFLNNASANGIVYTRGKLDTFQEGAPPNASPPQDGNFNIINNIAFVRGVVKPTIQLATRAELLLGPNSATVNANQKELAYKLVVAGLNDANTAGFNFLGAVGFGDDLTWDTTTLSDGDYDLIVRTRSIHNWLDNFNPDFTGDTNGATDSNEKWLKTLRTWYNQDNSPNNDDEGKIIVDNTQPSVSGFKPQ